MNHTAVHSLPPGGVTPVHDGLTSKQPSARALRTYKFRVHDTAASRLGKMAGAVNFTWNFCNDATKAALDFNGRWLSAFDLMGLSTGVSKDLGISSMTIGMVMTEYALRRSVAKKSTLAWRSRKRSLGWIPFRLSSFSISGDTVRYGKHYFRIWKSRDVVGRYLCGSFNQDARGRWYVNIVCEVPAETVLKTCKRVGIDLGLKTTATLSDGTSFHQAPFKAYEQRLAIAQRAGHKKHAKAIYAKISNVRKDYLHKETTRLVHAYDGIYVGNVNAAKLKKTRMAKSVSDQSWSMLRSMLAYKAIRLGVDYREVNEMFSTVTCSTCLQRTGPSGLSAIGVRGWNCQCGASHDRDVNAAMNILRVALDTPIKGAALSGGAKSNNWTTPNRDEQGTDTRGTEPHGRSRQG